MFDSSDAGGFFDRFAVKCHVYLARSQAPPHSIQNDAGPRAELCQGTEPGNKCKSLILQTRRLAIPICC